MSDILNLDASRQVLQDLVSIVEETVYTLQALLHQNAQNSAKSNQVLTQGHLFNSLEHIGQVREGFMLSQQCHPLASLTTLRDMVRDMVTDWSWLEQFNLSLSPADKPNTLGPQLIVYNHALIALGILPTLPAEAVTFPQKKRTYSDVNVPDDPESLLKRIEEIEHTLYQAEIRPVHTLAYAPLRRTYGFFEASRWLAKHHLAPLLNT